MTLKEIENQFDFRCNDMGYLVEFLYDGEIKKCDDLVKLDCEKLLTALEKIKEKVVDLGEKKLKSCFYSVNLFTL
jgi:hypothetical protein